MAGAARGLGQLAAFAIGNAIGGPVGGAIANTIFNILVPPVVPTTSTRLDDLMKEGVEIGDPIRKIYGVMPSTVGLIDCGYDKKGVAAAIEEKKKSSKSGGFLGIGGQTTTKYTYYLTGAFLVGEGPVFVDQIKLIDNDGERILYDRWKQGMPDPRSFEFRDLWNSIATQQQAYQTGQGFDLTPEYEGGELIAELHNNLRLYPGTERQKADTKLAAIHGADVQNYRGFGYIMFNHVKISGAPRIEIIARGPIDGAQAIVIDRFTQAGVPVSRIELTGLTGRIQGAAIAQVEAARDLVDKICTTQFFDPSFLNGAFRVFSRLNPYFFYLRKGETGAFVVGDNSDYPSKRNITLKAEKDRPTSITLQFFDPAENYEKNEVVAYRYSALYEKPVTIDMGMAMLFNDAQQLADIMLDELWADEGTEKISLLPEHSQIAQGSVVVYEDETGTRAIRVTEQDNGSKTALEQTGVKYDPGAYGIQKIIANPFKPRPTVPAYLTPFYNVANLPSIHPEAITQLGVYVGVGTAANADWDGALLVSDALGIEEELDSQALIATLVNAYSFTEADWPTWNEGQIIRVQIQTNGSFGSATNAQLKANGNIVALGDMVFSYRTATLVSAGLYDLEGILPGRFGTDWMVGQVFPSGTKVMQITNEDGESVGVEWIPVDNSLIGQEKAVEIYAAQLPAKTSGAITVPITGYGLKPLRPEVGRDTDDVTGEVTFQMWPRTRDYQSSANALNGSQTVETDGRVVILELLDGEDVVFTGEFGEGELPIEAKFTPEQLEGFYGIGLVPAKIKGRATTKGTGIQGFPRPFEL